MLKDRIFSFLGSLMLCLFLGSLFVWRFYPVGLLLIGLGIYCRLQIPPEIGTIHKVNRTESTTRIHVVITAQNARATLIYTKPVRFQHPANLDIYLRDTNGTSMIYPKSTLIKAIPDSVLKQHGLLHVTNLTP